MVPYGIMHPRTVSNILVATIPGTSIQLSDLAVWLSSTYSSAARAASALAAAEKSWCRPQQRPTLRAGTDAERLTSKGDVRALPPA